MRQRGRKTAAVIPFAVDGTRPRLEPPADLTEAERAAFVAVVNGTSGDHFIPAELPLIVAYAQAITISRQLARDPDKVREWEKLIRALALLATKLRLTPHTRRDAKTTATQLSRVCTDTPWAGAAGSGGEN